MALTTRRLTSRDVVPVARLIAEAMHDDPAYGYLFSSEARRIAALAEFFERNLAVHLPFECTFVLGDGSDIEATVTVRPPGGINLSLWTMLRNGLLPFGRKHGLHAVRRLLKLKATYDGLEASVSEHRPHFHVHMMAVAPPLQGRGLGSRLLTEALEIARERNGNGHSYATVLTTHKETNVTFYRRHGFDVVERRTLSLSPARPFSVWSMRRLDV